MASIAFACSAVAISWDAPRLPVRDMAIAIGLPLVAAAFLSLHLRRKPLFKSDAARRQLWDRLTGPLLLATAVVPALVVLLAMGRIAGRVSLFTSFLILAVYSLIRAAMRLRTAA